MKAKQSGGSDEPSMTDGSPRTAWYRPLGSAAAARHLAELVAERSVTVAPPGVTIDIDRGLVSPRDRGWSAPLAPLAARVAAIDPSSWSAVIDHEIARWCRVAAAISHIGALAPVGRAARAVVRLTEERNAVGETLRPAFGSVKWEMMYDLGPYGFAAVVTDPAERPAVSEQTWRRVATATVDRNHHRWARLTLGSGRGLVLSGPGVSALLFDSGWLSAAIGRGCADRGRATVFTNALVLIRPDDDWDSHPDVALAVESLREFTAGYDRTFEPFTITIDGVTRS